MRSLLLLAILAPLASAQQFHHFSGRVVDESGHPIEGAFFNNTAMPSSEYLERFTNAEGIFDIWTSAPIIVLRKSGYSSIVLRPEDTNDRLFKMLPEHGTFATCGGSRSSKPANPLQSSFKFRPTKQVRLLKKGYDVDYSFEHYGIKSDNKTTSILVGRSDAGGGWSTPLDQDVWNSVRYSERNSFINGIDVIDARGETKDGKRWRFLGRFTQSATYRDADPQTAAILDEFLDRTCLQLRP